MKCGTYVWVGVRRPVGIAALCAMLFPAAIPAAAGSTPEVIRHSGFRDFAAGTLGNSGANLYVSRDGRVQVINRWDLNSDGYVDIVISNDHNTFEVVDALIYWGSEGGYTSLLPPLWKEMPLAQILFDVMDGKSGVTRLPAFGGGKSVVADFNRDGYPDIVFCNYIHNYPGVRNAYVYWGGAEGYDVKRRTELPTNWATGAAAADLDADGCTDLIFANEGTEAGLQDISPSLGFDSYIYWGSPTGLDTGKRSLLGTRGAKDVAVGDVNNDGRVDIAFVNNREGISEVQLFLGGDGGYANDRTQSLPLPDPTGIRVSDVNGDGYCDLIVTTSGKLLSISYESKLDLGAGTVYILMGGPDGVHPDRTVELPAYQPRDCCATDLNRDGFPDIVVANGSAGDSRLAPSFVYWGSKQGFSAERRTELPALNPTGVVSADLNSDGRADLVFANSDDGQTCDVPSYIYWGSPTGFASYMRTELQTFGPASVSAADLNLDGKPDLVFVNRYSGTTDKHDVGQYIFWGNAHHYYSTASMTRLPGYGAYDTTAADLNNDGLVDMLLCNSYADTSYVYWGGTDGFSATRRAELRIGPAWGSSAADLNRDGYLDLVITHSSERGRVGTILWGSKKGYSEKRKTVLPLVNKRCLSNVIADLDRDGWLDLIFPDHYLGVMHIFWGSREGYSDSRSWAEFVSPGGLDLAELNGDGRLDFVVGGAFDPDRKSHNAKTRIFWGGPSGVPSREGVVELDAYHANECSIADLNRDRYLDIVQTNYMSDTTRSLPVFIYWGGKDGYSNDNRTKLPAESSCGVQTIDLNRDGYPEIVVHNHLKDGVHSIDSYIYWNGPQGLDETRRTGLPGFGPHFSQMTDPGNLYTRRMEEEYISAPIRIASGTQARRLSWEGDEAHGCRLRFQVRSADSRENLDQAKWTGPNGEGSFYEVTGAVLETVPTVHRWLQYRTIFTSPDGGHWPALSRVEIV